MNYKTKEDVMQRVREHHAVALEKYGDRVVGTFLQGSWNYSFALCDEESDVDTKCLLLPTFEDFCLGKKMVSTTHVLPNDEHIDFKDLRLYMSCFKKQNVNFVEILFTDFFVLNPLYEEQIQRLFDAREDIGRYDVKAALNCICGMAYEKEKALCHPYPTQKDIIEKYGFCYHEDTLFLTNDGWKNFDDINESDLLGTVNPETFELEYQSPLRRIKHKCEEGYMYDVENSFTHFCVTENHEIFSSPINNINYNGKSYSKEKCNWVKEKVQDFIKRRYHRHVLPFCINNNEEYNISDEELILIGAYISDGSMTFRNNNPKAIQISQSKDNPEFYKLMDQCAERLGGNKHIYSKETRWIFSSQLAKKIYSLCSHKSENKHLPYFITSLSERQAKLLLKMLLLGDGTRDEDGSRHVYYTISKKLANDMVTLGFMANRMSNKMGPYFSAGRYGDSLTYQIAIKDRENSPVWIHTKLNSRYKHVKKVEYNGDVCCFTVPNGLLITMYEGKPAVQSNCGKQLSHILRLDDFMKKYIAGKPYEDCLKPDTPSILLDVKRNKIYDVEHAKELANKFATDLKKLKDEYLAEHEVTQNAQVDALLDDVCVECMKLNFLQYLEK
jgi:hypothetical protein